MAAQVLVFSVPAQVKQDSFQTSLYSTSMGSYHWPEDYAFGNLRFIHFSDMSGLAIALMNACMAGASGGMGTAYPGSWTSGSTVHTGISVASASIAIRDGDGPGSGDTEGPAGWAKRAYASASGSRGSFRFTIPEPPAGYHIAFSMVHLNSDYGYNGQSVNVALGAGSFEYAVPAYFGAVTYHGTLGDITLVDDWYWWYWSGWWQTVDDVYVTAQQRVYSAELQIVYEKDEPPDNEETVENITDEEADLKAYNDCEEAWFEYNEKGHAGHHDTAHQYTQGMLTFHLEGLTPDTWYWYMFVKLCDGQRVEGEVFWFKTEPAPAMVLNIITLPATEVWATGATIHGELQIERQNNPGRQYCYLGFQYGSTSAACTASTPIWVYSGYYSSVRDRTNRYPIQLTIAGLLPDTTYYYRACLHIGTPPMTANNYYGQVMSFGGPVSMFGLGREYVTAKKAADDVSRMAAGRYYMDKTGILRYESYQHRLTTVIVEG